MRRPIIGVMGGARVSREVYNSALHLGELIAKNGWLLLNGGRNAGVMRAATEGAKRKGGTTIGILPGNDAAESNPFIDIPIVTNMGDARNVINVLTSDVVVACPGSAGTISEIALALKNYKHVILLGWSLAPLFEEERSAGQLLEAQTAEQCVALISRLLKT
jgi:uncharacterized protein (TIGR00725 family)